MLYSFSQIELISIWDRVVFPQAGAYPLDSDARLTPLSTSSLMTPPSEVFSL